MFLQGNPGLTVPISLGLCRGLTRINAPTYVKTTPDVARAAQAIDWPRLAETRGSLRHALALTGASGEPPDRSLSQAYFQYRRRRRTTSSPKPSRSWRWPRRMAFTGAAMVPPKKLASKFLSQAAQPQDPPALSSAIHGVSKSFYTLTDVRALV